ncbi:MAG: glutamine-hydrolyzing GMP synthase [Thermoguttaceae bacterium]
MPTTHHQTILVLNFGSQYDQLIVRRVRQCSVYAVFAPHTITAEDVRKLQPIGIILSGGPNSVYEDGSPKCDAGIFELGIPVLGICYGMQIMAQTLGGEVASFGRREYGQAMFKLRGEARTSPLTQKMPDESQVWMSHGDHVVTLPPGFVVLGSTDTLKNAMMMHTSKPLFGVQFHPEVVHTIEGMVLFRNFVELCGATRDWTMESFAEREVKRVAATVGEGRVICGLSGGVDSAVVAALLARAIGAQLSCILVDNGLMRKNEVATVEREFRGRFPDVDFRVVNAAERFLSVLAGVAEPQEKRRRIGHTFIDVFSEEAAKIKNVKFLAQGTIYPDVIESGGGSKSQAATIKLHHNVGGLPDNLEFVLIEPLRELFKDEVRALGLELGLPEAMVWRHPFPGPGLAVRCLEEVTTEKLALLREADAIVIEEILRAGLYRDISQAFAVLLPIKSVGVMGDARTYEYAAAVRCVKTDDFMTATVSEIPFPVLTRIATRIVNEVRGINRIAYDITSKPPATIEWE